MRQTFKLSKEVIFEKCVELKVGRVSFLGLIVTT